MKSKRKLGKEEIKEDELWEVFIIISWAWLRAIIT